MPRRLTLPAAAALPGVPAAGVVAHDETHEAAGEGGEPLFGIATGGEMIPQPQVDLVDKRRGLNLVPLAIASKERPRGALEPTVTPSE